MSRERQLQAGGEDPHPDVAVALGGEHEDRLRVVHLPRQSLHLLPGEARGVREHRQLVASQGHVGERVDDEVGDLLLGALGLPQRCKPPALV